MAKDLTKKTVITVVAKQDKPRWRGGLKFTQEPSEAEVSDEQLEAIKADPFLAIVATAVTSAPAKA